MKEKAVPRCRLWFYDGRFWFSATEWAYAFGYRNKKGGDGKSDNGVTAIRTLLENTGKRHVITWCLSLVPVVSTAVLCCYLFDVWCLRSVQSGTMASSK